MISDREAIATGLPGLRLSTGHKVGEVLSRAEAWWTNKGARQMRLEAMRQRQTGGRDWSNGVEFAQYRDSDLPNFLPSGILAGFSWDQLTGDEKVSIAYAYFTQNMAPKDHD